MIIRNREFNYLFFNRKAQISISILLIFVLIISMFSIVLYSSVESTAGYKFRNNLDYAVLSAGSTLSKGAQVYINFSATRMVLYSLSNLLWLVVVFSPEKAKVVKKINNKIKKVSCYIGRLQHYIPLLYTVLGEIEGSKNYYIDNRESSKIHDNKSINIALIIPSFVLKEILDGNEDKDFKDLIEGYTKIENFYSIFTSGFTGVALRERKFFEKLKAIFSIKRKTVFEDYDFFMNSCKIYKRTPESDSFFDLSFAINLDNILTEWDKSDKKKVKDFEN